MKDILIEFIKRYAPVDDEQAGILADYALATWHPLPDEVMYLHITGDRGTGKTILGRVMAAICKNPMIDNGFSPVGLLTALDMRYPATLIIDDANVKSNDLRTLLECGWGKYISITRMIETEKGAFYPEVYKTHGYKIILSHQPFNNPSIERRCIRVNLNSRKHDFISQIVFDEKQFASDASAMAVMLSAMYELDDDGNEQKHFDLSILDDFDTDLYGMDRRKMTPKQRLQVKLANILYSSVAEAKHTVRNEKTEVLEHALALATHEGQKSMSKMLSAELNRREKKGK